MLLASAYDTSKYFNAADVKTDTKLRVKAVTEELVGIGADQEKKLVVWFANSKKGLVLNRVNNRSIRTAYGDAVADWVGRIIVVYATEAEFRGRMVPCVRVRIPPPKASPETTPPAKAKPDDLDDEITF